MLSSIFNCILIEVTVEEYTMNIIEPNHSLMLILLSKLTGDESVDEIYNRTRFAWKTNIDRARSVDYVISHNSNEEIVGIFKPTKWLKGDDKEFTAIARGTYPDRIGFVGDIASEEIQEMYADSLTPPRKKGAANPIRYIDLNNEEDEVLSALDELSIDEQDSHPIQNHTYLAGIAVEDDGIDDLVSAALHFLETEHIRLHKNPQIYMVGRKNSKGNFLANPEDTEMVKIFQGSFLNAEDEEPTEEMIRKFFADNSNLSFMDEGYCCIWFAFEYPEESEEDFEQPGEHWEEAFQSLAVGVGELNLILMGYNSEHEKIIWQQWSDGDFDEGAISNPDQFDYYAGSNLESIHKVSLGCFELLN